MKSICFIGLCTLLFFSLHAHSLVDVTTLGADASGKKDATGIFVNALKAHSRVYVPKGRYLVSGLSLSGATLFGEGTLFAVEGKPVLVIGKGANRIEGLSFETQSSQARAEIQLTEESEDVIVEKCRFTGKAYSALGADTNGKDDSSLVFKRPARRIHILNNTFSGYITHLYLHSVEEVMIKNNFFQESFYDAIRLRQRVKKVIVESNQFKNIGSSKQVVSRDAIDTYWSGQELIIRSNIIEGASALGLDLKGVDPDGLYKNTLIIVSDNIIKNTAYSGILFSSAAKPLKGLWPHVGPIVIRGNVIEGANTLGEHPNNAAIWLRHGVADAIVSHNIIKDPKGHGIGVNNFEKLAPINENIIVTNNLIQGCKGDGSKVFGIYLHKIKGELIQSNRVSGCKRELKRD